MTTRELGHPALELPGGVRVAEAMEAVLVTGATGFIGKVLVARLLHDAEALGLQRLYVLIRPKSGHAPAERLQRDLLSSPCLDGLSAAQLAKVRVVSGDPTLPGLGMEPELRETLGQDLTHVLHVAASVRFDLPLSDAALQNTHATLAMQDWAREMPRLRRLVLVSTAYVTPWRETPVVEASVTVSEDPEALFISIVAGRERESEHLARTGHPNTYTFTKALAEQIALRRQGDLPMVIVRPSIVSACRQFPRAGWIDSVAAFGAFASLVLAGRLRVILGGPGERLDIVPCDEVVSRIVAAAAEPLEPGQVAIRHAVSGIEQGQTVAELAGAVLRHAQAMPLGARPEVRYLGHHGLRGRLMEWWHHQLPLTLQMLVLGVLGQSEAVSQLRWLRGNLASINATFRHFTTHTYRFVSTWPIEAPVQHDAYVGAAIAGLRRHLAAEWSGHAVIAGSEAKVWSSDWAWFRSLRAGHLVLRLAALLMLKVLRKAFTTVSVDVDSFRRHLADLPPGTPMAILPTHRSFLDFVLVSYLGVTRPELGMPIPHVAAAEEFSRVPLLGWFFRKAHAFFIRRGQGRADERLNDTVRGLVDEGKAIEFYPEGQRSRTRQFLPPRTGMIRSLQATGRDILLVPVAISFERLAEEDALALEREGHPRPPFTLGPLLRWTRRMWRGEVRLGRVHMACAEPLVLRPADDARAAAEAVVARLRKATVVTRWHLETFLDHHPVPGISVDDIVRWIEARGGRVLTSGTPEQMRVSRLVADSLVHQWLHHFVADARLLHPEDPFLASLDALWATDTAQAEARTAAAALRDPACQRFVSVVYGPLLLDAHRTIQSMSVFASPRVHHAVSLMADLPGASFANVELAMAFQGARPGPARPVR
ncbi:MAG: SDR family oxidoreductase [Candidatus Sericytochromatia bacterium]|nr:SDR family oxidoreductase [Candidatus Sericytochromatia bacterium]